jgi:hypothetical protein
MISIPRPAVVRWCTAQHLPTRPRRVAAVRREDHHDHNCFPYLLRDHAARGKEPAAGRRLRKQMFGRSCLT